MITAQALDTLLTEEYLARPAEADTYEIVFMAVQGLLMILLVQRVSVLFSVPLLFFVLGKLCRLTFTYN